MYRRTGTVDMLCPAQLAGRLALILAGLLLLGALRAPAARAQAEAGTADVLPGAFGESIDSLDAATRESCFECADRALNQLRADYFERTTTEIPFDRYLQILQTTLILPETQPPDATDIERAIWSETYADAAGVVSFVALTNSLNIGDVPYAECSESFDYAVRKDGTAARISLRAARSRFFADMIIPGVRVINLGGHHNAVYTASSTVNRAGMPLLEYLCDSEPMAFAENFETDFPVSVSVRHDGEAGGAPRTVGDPETIRAVFEALSSITVLGESPVSGHTDDSLNYYFEMADGRVIYGWTFQGGMLIDDRMGLHEITGFEALQRSLPDPGL